MWGRLWPSYFCWTALVLPAVSRAVELGESRANWWRTDWQGWDWTQITETWSHCLFTIPSYYLSTRSKKSLEMSSWRWLERSGKLDSHTTLHPIFVVLKIPHFLYNFSINPKTAFTEGHLWTEQNRTLPYPTKLQGSENLSKVPSWGQER